MNKICIVARNFETYFVKRLIAEVGQDRLLLSNPWEVSSLPEASLYLARTTGVYRNLQDLHLLSQVPPELIINPLPALKTFRTKPVQYQFFQDQHIAHLPWISLMGATHNDIAASFSKWQIKQVVVKPFAGLGGWGIQALRLDECLKWWEQKQEEKDEEYLLQPYVQADEYRVFFVDEKRWTLKRLPGKNIAANFASQGEAQVASLPALSIKIVEDLIKKSAARYGAIDLFVDQDQVFILELNTCPGTQQLEQVTQTNIMLEIVKSFKINH